MFMTVLLHSAEFSYYDFFMVNFVPDNSISAIIIMLSILCVNFSIRAMVRYHDTSYGPVYKSFCVCHKSVFYQNG